MSPERFTTFSAVYRVAHLEAVAARPEHYRVRPPDTPESWAERTATRTLDTLATAPHRLDYDSDSFRRTCKALGIRQTRKDVIAYINGEGS